MSTAPVTNGLEHVDVLIVGAGTPVSPRRLHCPHTAHGHTVRTSAVRRHFRPWSAAFVLVGAVHGCPYTETV